MQQRVKRVLLVDYNQMAAVLDDREPGVLSSGDAGHMLDLTSLGDFADWPTANLPEGLRKLTDIAIALALKPRLLLLDEPTSGVSTAEKFPLMDTIVRVLRAEKVTALFVEHDMDVVERYADRVLVWDAGRVVAAGPPHEVLRNSHVLERVIGIG